MAIGGREANGIAAAGAVLVAIGVALGAFGAHALERSVDARALGWWTTGVQYQVWSGLGLLALGATGRALRVPAGLIGAGAVLFAGTLYAMTLGAPRWLGMVTPVGGALMIVGWSLAAWHLARGARA